jgi:hypothetical protein
MSRMGEWPARAGRPTWFAVYNALLGLAFAALGGFDEVRALSHQASRTEVANPLFNALAIAGPWLVGIAGLAVLYLHRSAWIRGSALALTAVSVAVDVSFRIQNGAGYTPNEASLFWQELDLVDDAVRFFAGSAAGGIATGLAVALALGRLPRRLLPEPRGAAWLLLPMLASGAYYQLLKTTDASVIEFPLPYRAPLLTAYAYRYQTHFHGVREAPYFDPTGPPLADHVVVVMDESIRGDLLHLNGSPLPTTPYLDSVAREVFNYGVASAIANLSGGSNIVVQSGLRPDQLPDTELRSLTQPTLFAYYARAGFFTSYVNAQGVRNRPPNFLSRRDAEGIDRWIDVRTQRPDLPEWEVDREILGLVAENIREHERSFTWVLKAGIHFPYEGKFPEAVHWTGPIAASGLSSAEQEVVRSYLAALRWTVDDFLAQFVEGLRALRDERVLVVYTADHGQSLFEDHPGHPEWRALRGHGTPGRVPPQQAMVPLMLFALHPEVKAALEQRYQPRLRDRTSAFELFPTLLLVAGYDRGDLRSRYHVDLFDGGAERRERRFVSGNHFGAGGPLYRPAPYRSVFSWNEFHYLRGAEAMQTDR